MFGEVVVFFNPELARDFNFFRKQGSQLASSMRFIAVQFEAFHTDDLWPRNAQLANNMAALREREVRNVPHLTITQPVDANPVFAAIPPRHLQPLTQEYFFYVWDEEQSIVRRMTSLETTQEDIMGFVALFRRVLGRPGLLTGTAQSGTSAQGGGGREDTGSLEG